MPFINANAGSLFWLGMIVMGIWAILGPWGSALGAPKPAEPKPINVKIIQ